MATIAKMIKASLAFLRMKPEELLAAGYNVVTNLTGNSNYPNTPVDLNVLKGLLDAFHVSIGEAKDGGKRAILLRNEQSENIGHMLRMLANYVEIQCKGDMHIFLSSGFQPRVKTRPAAQPLDQPSILEVEQGPSGTLLTSINGVRRAKSYECRFGIIGSGGTAPAFWTSVTVSHAKSAAPISGLTPGTTYAIQVRAFGPLGFTDWSPSATRMAI